MVERRDAGEGGWKWAAVFMERELESTGKRARIGFLVRDISGEVCAYIGAFLPGERERDGMAEIYIHAGGGIALDLFFRSLAGYIRPRL